MPLPNIETFEGDIAEEIHEKETTMTDIIAAKKVAENEPQRGTSTLLLLVAFFIFGLVIVFSGAYYLYTKTAYPSQSKEEVASALPQKIAPVPTVSFAEILPVTSSAISRFVTDIRKEESGYVFTVQDYQAVYGYLLHHESSFGEEALALFGGTTTDPIIFTDFTQTNQDMRVLTASSSSGVAYGFIGANTLLLATSPVELLSLRSAILK